MKEGKKAFSNVDAQNQIEENELAKAACVGALTLGEEKEMQNVMNHRGLNHFFVWIFVVYTAQ